MIRGGMIDLHCHVLPGIDDGPRTMQDAVALARVAYANGIGTLVATPHVDPVHLHNDAARIAHGVADVRAALVQEGVPVDVTTGAEVALGRVIDLGDDELVGLRLGGGPWLLLECPLSPAAAYGFATAARHVAGRGHRVLLAHPERSPAFHGDPVGTLGPLVREGMLSQVTAGAFVGRFGRRVQEVAVELMRAGLVHTVASDAHDAISRPPSIAAELAEAGVEGWTEWLAYDVPAAILAGAAIPPAPVLEPPSPPSPARRWWRLGR
jgi:protein-tyrosine phosphatase